VPPRVSPPDHWHASYGIYVCGEWLPAIPQFDEPNEIHTHSDGVIHIHPHSANAAGENARLKVFLEGAGVELTDDTLKVGEDEWKEGEDECDGQAAELVLAKWQDVQTSTKKPALIPSDFGDTRFREDGEGYTIAFVPTDQAEGEGDEEIPKPESSASLSELGAVDAGGTTTSSTAPGETTASTAPGETTAPTTAGEGTGTTATTAPPAEGDG
jgi:hypothetical protein